MANDKGVIVVDGRARFVAERTVRVTGGDDFCEITANTVIINTGSETAVPPIDGADLPRVVDSTSAQKLDKAPESLAIIGAGPIGLEFATMFSGFGTQVTLLNSGHSLLTGMEESVAEKITFDLETAPIKIVNDAAVSAITTNNDTEDVDVSWSESFIRAEKVLIARGRRPATVGLDLDKAGVKTTDSDAVQVDEHLRTTAGVELDRGRARKRRLNDLIHRGALKHSFALPNGER